MFPKYSELQYPLLKEIANRGGVTRPSDFNHEGKTVYQVLADYFDLSTELRMRRKSEHDKRLVWDNMVQWARNDLRKAGLINNSERGIWRLSPEAYEHLEKMENEQIARGNYSNITKVSLDVFREIQENYVKIGEEGEQFVLDYERRRLADIGKEHLIPRIKQMSVEDVSAGYDILSFDENENKIYIEVKSTTTSMLEFELTKNELEKSKAFGESYWIYRVIKIRSSFPEIVTFQDPYNLIKEKKLELKPTSYKVTILEG